MSCDCCCDCSCEADLDILPSNLKFKSIKDIQMPEEFNTYEEIEKLILNYNLENLESTFLSLKQILDADIALDQVVFNTLGYFKNFYKPDHFKNLETLLSTEYDINYKTYSIKLESVSNPNHTTNDKMNSDNLSYVKKMCRSNKTETKHNLMCIACREGHINCVNYLLTTNLHLDREIARNAAFGGNMEIIQTLESKNLSFDYCLECAIARHHYALCDYLIKNYRCEKIDAKRCLEFYNFRAFYFCLENNLTKEMFIEDIAQRHYFYFFKYMAKQGFTGQVPRETILKHMIDKKYIEYVRFVFENFKIVETKDQKVIMKKVVKTKNEDLLKLFIENGYDLNIKSSLGTPLTIAVINNDIELVKYLLEKGADINITSNGNYRTIQFNFMEFFINLIICTTKFIIISHETPLTNAVENHNYEIVKILLDHGVDFSVGSNNIATLDIAIKSHDDSLALMIAKKIQVVDIVLLVKVIEMNNIPLAKILIPKCDKIRLDSLVKLAARGNSLEILMLLIENGALSQRKPVEPLIIACRYNYIEIAKVLIQNGVNVNGTKYEKPLIISTQNNFFEISNLLIENGADVNCCLYKNNTPLFNACLNNNVELVKLLIEKGAHREIDHNDPLFEALSPDIVNLIQ